MKTKHYPLIILAINCLIILLTTYFPFQDLPQHLTYSKIFADYNNNEMFSKFYNLPSHFDPYFTFYYLMFPFTKLFGSSIWAFKIVLVIYAVLTYLASIKVMNVFKIERSWVKDSLFSALIFNGTLYMGFVAYALMQPLFMFCVSYFVQMCDGRREKWKKLLVSLFIMSIFHIFASFAFFLFIFIYCVYSCKRENWIKAFLSFIFYVAVVASFYIFGDADSGGFENGALKAAMDTGFGIEWIGLFFRITWSNQLTVVNYILWHFIGPYNNIVLLCCSPFLVYILYLSYKSFNNQFSFITKVVFTYLVVCMLLPWGIEKPSEITYINYRFFTFGIPFLLLVVLGSMNLPSRVLLMIIGFFFASNTANLVAYHYEASAANSVIDRVPDNKILGSLVFRNQSTHFSKMHRADHFLPMYYSIKGRGVNSQFWANYTHHLPIGYKFGRAINLAADWRPTDFKPEQLNSIDYLFVEYNIDGDGIPQLALSSNAKRILNNLMKEVTCNGQFCLYEKK